MPVNGPASYAGAGVNLEAADESVRRIAALVASTARPEVLDGIGGFGGSFALDTASMRSPVLVVSTDGVGTKLAGRAGRRTLRHGRNRPRGDVRRRPGLRGSRTALHARLHIDRVARPRSGRDPRRRRRRGMQAGGCALLGGELAEHPGEMAPGTFDMAGFAVGVVERDARIGPDKVEVGDVLVALPSPGLRSNGFSLVRNVLLERAGMALDGPAWPGADSTLADELLRPSVIYAPTVLAAVRTGFVHAAADITGGGLPGNLVPRDARGL